MLRTILCIYDLYNKVLTSPHLAMLSEDVLRVASIWKLSSKFSILDLWTATAVAMLLVASIGVVVMTMAFLFA